MFDHSHWIAMSPLTLVDDRPPVIVHYCTNLLMRIHVKISLASHFEFLSYKTVGGVAHWLTLVIHYYSFTDPGGMEG